MKIVGWGTCSQVLCFRLLPCRLLSTAVAAALPIRWHLVPRQARLKLQHLLVAAGWDDWRPCQWLLAAHARTCLQRVHCGGQGMHAKWVRYILK